MRQTELCYHPQTKFAKVMFLQVSIHRGACVVAGRGACVVAGGGGHASLLVGGGAGMVKGRGACVGYDDIRRYDQ